MRRIPIVSQECQYEIPYGYIYLLKNKFNEHLYVGKHVWNHKFIDKSYWGSGGRHLESAKIKYGFYEGIEVFDRMILQWIDTNDFDLKISEIYWIDLLGTHRNPEDYNETPGGDGFSEFTPEMRSRWSDMFSGENNPMHGTHRTEEQKEYLREISLNPSIEARKLMSEASLNYLNNQGGREHISETSKKYWNSEKGEQRKLEQSKENSGENNYFYGVHLFGEQNGMYGKQISEEQKNIISDTQSVAIVQLNKDNSFVAEWESIVLASKTCSISNYGISACCRKEQKSSGGYIWMYKSEYIESVGGIENYEESKGKGK